MDYEPDIRRQLKAARVLVQDSLALLSEFRTTIEQAETQVSVSQDAIARSRQRLRALRRERE